MNFYLVTASPDQWSINKRYEVLKRYEIQVSMFTNKALLAHAMLTNECIVYGCFLNTLAELGSCDREYVSHKTWKNYYVALCETLL